MKILSKLPEVGTTIFTVMSGLAREHEAIDLSQGYPDYSCSEDLIALVNEAMAAGQNQYAPMAGLPSLQEAISDKIQRLYGWRPDPEEEITISPGGTYGIYTALTTVIRPGDEVILFEPAYDSYIPNVVLNGGIPVPIPLSYPEYGVDFDLVKSRINFKTRMIILNTPHNPTGSVWSRKDMETLEELLQGTRILVLSDEVYEHLVFDGQEHQSVLRFPGLRSRSFAVYSFGKLLHNTGWKIGYMVACPELTREYRKVHQFLCFSVNTPMQAGIAAFIQQPESYAGISEFFQAKRDYFISLLAQTPFRPLACRGSYFILLSYRDISELPDREFALKLIREQGIASIPVSVFYQDHRDDLVLRFCFGKKSTTLFQAVDRLKNLKSLR